MKPKFKEHDHTESNCKVCRDYVNKLDDHRQSIPRGESKSKVVIRLDRTSDLNKSKTGKRKFDTPKPVLSRPFLVKPITPGGKS